MAPETIGFIGLGVMGKPMAKNLIKAGHQLVVHSRTRASVDEVVAAGAAAAVSPADVARRTTMVITMLPDTADVELVLTGPDGGLAAAHLDHAEVPVTRKRGNNRQAVE